MEEVGEAPDERRVDAGRARHVVHRNAARLRAELAAERQRHDGGLVPAGGKLVGQGEHEPLLPADAEPLHDVDDAHRSERLTLHEACASSS